MALRPPIGRLRRFDREIPPRRQKQIAAAARLQPPAARDRPGGEGEIPRPASK